ncbi:MAG: hypothetical protein C1943_08455 [Halochromatium sp.]|nr:hypothetical protein [Halochromatium sp.]
MVQSLKRLTHKPTSNLSAQAPVLAEASARHHWGQPLNARRFPRWRLLGCLLLIFLASCGSSGPAQRDQFFTLQPRMRTTPSAQTVPASLLVTPLASRGFLGGTQILFRTAADPLEVQRYDLLLWDGVPGRALAEALISGLRTAGTFRYVVSVADRAQADFILNGELSRLEHLPTADPPQVSAAFNLTLIANRNRAIQFSHSYSGTEPTPASTPAGMVTAFNHLTGQLLSQAIADIQRLAPKLSATRASGD